MISNAKPDVKSLQLEDVQAAVEDLGEPAYRASQIVRWLYEKKADGWNTMTDLPAALRQKLDDHFGFEQLNTVRVLGSADTTQKFLFRLADGSLIESVLIPASPALYGQRSDRRTICVSTQVGCAYGCRFCASGLDGFSRNLRPNEIVNQVMMVEKSAGARIDNIVFMGMGEPLANLQNLLARHPDHQFSVGTGDRRAPHYGLDQRPGAANPEAR